MTSSSPQPPRTTALKTENEPRTPESDDGHSLLVPHLVRVHPSEWQSEWRQRTWWGRTLLTAKASIYTPLWAVCLVTYPYYLAIATAITFCFGLVAAVGEALILTLEASANLWEELPAVYRGTNADGG